MDKILIEAPNSDQQVIQGVIAVNGNNTDYGSIRMATTKFTTSDSGFMNKSRRVYFQNGSIENLKEFVGAYGLKVGDDYSKKVAPSRLIAVESTEPFFEGQQPKINPNDGAVLQKDGEDIYRQIRLVADNSAHFDELIQHDTEASLSRQLETAEEFAEVEDATEER